MSGLNKDIPVPLYHQLKDVILKGILAGDWKPDQQLPTEDDLATRFRVSKITVRQALRDLAALGYVRREQGRGTFVQRPHLEQGPRELTSFTEEMKRRGSQSMSRVLDQHIIAPSPEVAARLRIRPHEQVFQLRRVRIADKEPMAIQTAHIPVSLVPGIDTISFAGDVSLYDVLQSRYGLRAVGGKETHFAALVRMDEAELLWAPAHTAAMHTERVTYLANARPLEFAQATTRGDRYSIELDLSTDLTPRRA
jgi:GntR family transcriptional regulator, N-acetylglucosamine utilization regulator